MAYSLQIVVLAPKANKNQNENLSHSKTSLVLSPIWLKAMFDLSHFGLNFLALAFKFFIFLSFANQLIIFLL